MKKRIALVALLGLNLCIPSILWGFDLRFINSQTWKTGFKTQNIELGGLSGLVFDSAKNELLAVSDDRGKIGPPRIHHFSVSEKKGEFTLVPTAITLLVDEKGKKFELGSVDFESIVALPNGHYLISSEGDIKLGIKPGFFEFTKEGKLVSKKDLPAHFMPESKGMTAVRGVRNNLAIEGLTGNPKGEKLMYAPEDALAQDLASPTPETSLLRFVITKGNDPTLIDKEYVYEISKGGSDNGISALMALDDSGFLSLERAYLPLIKKNVIKIFQNKITASSTNVMGQENIRSQKLVPIEKKLVFDLEDLITSKKIPHLDNFEGMIWGPKLGNKKTLILVSDNNFGSPQETIFLFFEVTDDAP